MMLYISFSCTQCYATFQENSVHDLEVNDAIASRMSLFYAHATPMLKVLSDTTSKFVSEVISSYNTIDATSNALMLLNGPFKLHNSNNR